jgi:hypothetical protein
MNTDLRNMKLTKNVIWKGKIMGMDVEGRDPDTSEGQYFQANVWSWRPIRALIDELCADLLDEETLSAMSCNDGAGPKDQKTCTEMAIRFDNWMERHVDGHRLECSEMRVAEDGHFVSEQELLENPDIITHSPYEVSDEKLGKWINFLRHCGGFKVY